MAKRLIDADKFLQWVVKRFKCVPLVGSCYNDEESMSLLLAQAPTVDAVEVVRCKDCVYFKTLPEDDYNICLHAEKGIVCPEPTDFCSYGEQREG